MLPYNAAAQAIREKARHINQRDMVWIKARSRSTNELHGIGLWTGDDVEDIAVTDILSGVTDTRTFHNKGLLGIGSVRYEVGLNIRPITISLSAIDEAVLDAINLYDPRGAEVQMWRRSYDANDKPVAVEPWDFGYINGAPSERPAPGGSWSIEVELVTETRLLSEPSELRKSDQAQRRRNGDRFRRWKSQAKWSVPWGTKDVRHPQDTP